MIILNDDQALCVRKIQSFLSNPDNRGGHFVVSGPPGSGKTTLTRQAVENVTGKVFGCTIAHAAKNRLQDGIGEEYRCFTVAQMLGYSMSESSSNDEIKFVRKKGAIKKITEADIVILDECSMIGDDLYEDIMQECALYNIFLIALGDKRQCPPVGQDDDSPFFKNIGHELTKIERFSGNIGVLEKTFRGAIDNLELEEDKEDHQYDQFLLNSVTGRKNKLDASKSGYVFLEGAKDMVKRVAYEAKRNKDNINHIRLLAFRNPTIVAANRSIRKLMYNKSDLQQFEPGEIVISNGGYSIGRIPIVHNGFVGRVEDSIEADTSPYDIPSLKVKLSGIEQTIGTIFTVQDTPEAKEAYKYKAQELVDNAQRDPRQWYHYWNFVNSFAKFDYALAMTIYKSQGQTMNQAVVYVGDVSATKPLNPKQRYQALYVACTRAKHRVYICTNVPAHVKKDKK